MNVDDAVVHRMYEETQLDPTYHHATWKGTQLAQLVERMPFNTLFNGEPFFQSSRLNFIRIYVSFQHYNNY